MLNFQWTENRCQFLRLRKLFNELDYDEVKGYFQACEGFSFFRFSPFNKKLENYDELLSIHILAVVISNFLRQKKEGSQINNINLSYLKRFLTLHHQSAKHVL